MRVKDPSLALERPPPLHADVRGASLAQLKPLLRSTPIGLEDPVRDWLWVHIALKHCAGADTQFDGQFESLLSTNKLPKFVEPRLARFFALNDTHRQEVTSVLWHLSQCESISARHSLTFSPQPVLT